MNELSDGARETILKKIDCFYPELLKKYEVKKYNEQEYERLCAAFRSPGTIDPKKDIEDALAWKYGKTRANLRKNGKYKPVIKILVGGWKSFVESGTTSGDQVFIYWNARTKSSYISVAFIAHLIAPREIPIVDQHTFRAVRYFLDLVGVPHKIKRKPTSIDEIHALKGFVDYFSSAKEVTRRDLDKYLMMFGKHVAPR